MVSLSLEWGIIIHPHLYLVQHNSYYPPRATKDPNKKVKSKVVSSFHSPSEKEEEESKGVSFSCGSLWAVSEGAPINRIGSDQVDQIGSNRIGYIGSARLGSEWID